MVNSNGPTHSLCDDSLQIALTKYWYWVAGVKPVIVFGCVVVVVRYCGNVFPTGAGVPKGWTEISQEVAVPTSCQFKDTEVSIKLVEVTFITDAQAGISSTITFGY